MGLKPATNPDIEATTIELSIDGKTVTAKDGVSLYDEVVRKRLSEEFGVTGMQLVVVLGADYVEQSGG